MIGLRPNPCLLCIVIKQYVCYYFVTSNLDKVRSFSFPNRGKSGSVRVCYVDFVIQEAIYLVTVYSKKVKDNLTQTERNNIKKMIILLEENLKEAGN